MQVKSETDRPAQRVTDSGASGVPSDSSTQNYSQVVSADDATLLGRFAGDRDHVAFEAIVKRYERLVMGVALRQVGDRHRAEDVFQAVFLVLAEQARKIKKPSSLASWLHGTARRIGLQALRESRRDSSMDQIDQEPTNDDPVLTKLQAAFEQQAFDEELDRLADRLRLPLVLHYLEGMTAKEVGERLHLSTDTVEGRLKKGRKVLRGRLARHGIGVGALTAAFQLSQQIAKASTGELVRSTSQSSVAWVTHQPLEGCSANAVSLAGKEMAAMTAAKTTTLLTTTALICLAGGMFGALAVGGLTDGGSGDSVSNASVSAEPITGSSSRGLSDDVQVTIDMTLAQAEDQAATLAEVRKAIQNDGLKNYARLSEVRERIESILDQQIVDVEFLDTELSEVATFLGDQFGVPIRIDEVALADEGFGLDTPVTFRISQLTSRNTLEVMLDELDLDYIIKNDILTITTVTEADENMETVIYEARHLGNQITSEDLVVLIQDGTSGEWIEADGSGGTIRPLPGGVMVRHNQRTHREVNALIDQLSQFTSRSDLPEVDWDPNSLHLNSTRSNSANVGSGGGFFQIR